MSENELPSDNTVLRADLEGLKAEVASLKSEKENLIGQLHTLKEAIKPCFAVDMSLSGYLGNSVEGKRLSDLYQNLPIHCEKCDRLEKRVLYLSDVIKNCDSIPDTTLLAGARGPTAAEVQSGKAEDIDPLAFLDAK
jgi:hypothetical protein